MAYFRRTEPDHDKSSIVTSDPRSTAMAYETFKRDEAPINVLFPVGDTEQEEEYYFNPPEIKNVQANTGQTIDRASLDPILDVWKEHHAAIDILDVSSKSYALDWQTTLTNSL